MKQVKIYFTGGIAEEKANQIERNENYSLKDEESNVIQDIIKDIRLDKEREFEVLTFKDKLDDRDKEYIIQKSK